MLSGVCVATPVLPSGRRCPRPAGRAVPGTEDGTDWTSGGKWGRVEDAAEGEGENRGGKEKYRQTDDGRKKRRTMDYVTNLRRAFRGQQRHHLP